MTLDDILATIDAEIARLQQARTLLAGTSAGTRGKGTPTAKPDVKKAGRKKHKLSAEGRKRIIEAVRKRWAAQKRARA